MKATVLYVFVLVVALASSQPTHDDFKADDDCDCASEQDLETLRNEVTLLSQKFDRVLGATVNRSASADVTTPPSVSPRASERLCLVSCVLILGS